MKWKFSLIGILLLMTIASCKKDTQVSSQTISLLQNKWTLVSESIIYPTNTSLNSTYTGTSTDYYWFNLNDSLAIHEAGSAVLLFQPISITLKYSFLNNNTLIYGPNTNVHINIATLTNNLLVLTNATTATFTNGSNPSTIYNGTRIDSLKR